MLEAARLHGWWAYHVRDSRRGIVQGNVGFPDLVLCNGRRTLFRELKSDRGRLDPAQVLWGEVLEDAGQDWAVWRPTDWDAIVAELAGRT